MPSSGVQTCALDRKSTRLNSSHGSISYAVFCLKKKHHGLRDNLEFPAADRQPVLVQVHPTLPPDPIEQPQVLCPVPPAETLDVRFFFLNNPAPPDLSPLPQPNPLPS